MELLGLSPQYLFSLECFTQTLPDSQADLLWDYVIDSDADNFDESEPCDPKVFLLSGWGQSDSLATDSEESESDGQGRRFWTCWCAIHSSPQLNLKVEAETFQKSNIRSLFILEFELERDLYNPLYPLESSDENSSSDATAFAPVSEPISTVGQDLSENISSLITPDDINMAELFVSTEPGLEGDIDWIPSNEAIFESTCSRSKPIKALTRMRQVDRTQGSSVISKDGLSRHAISRNERAYAGGARSGVGTLDIFSVLTQIDEQLSSAQDLQTLLDIVVGVVNDLTQFHRVLVYQFDERWNGEVVAELMDWKRTQDIYKGLFFPASDIPPQVRLISVIGHAY